MTDQETALRELLAKGTDARPYVAPATTCPSAVRRLLSMPLVFREENGIGRGPRHR